MIPPESDRLTVGSKLINKLLIKRNKTISYSKNSACISSYLNWFNHNGQGSTFQIYDIVIGIVCLESQIYFHIKIDYVLLFWKKFETIHLIKWRLCPVSLYHTVSLDHKLIIIINYTAFDSKDAVSDGRNNSLNRLPGDGFILSKG